MSSGLNFMLIVKVCQAYKPEAWLSTLVLVNKTSKKDWESIGLKCLLMKNKSV